MFRRKIRRRLPSIAAARRKERRQFLFPIYGSGGWFTTVRSKTPLKHPAERRSIEKSTTFEKSSSNYTHADNRQTRIARDFLPLKLSTDRVGDFRTGLRASPKSFGDIGRKDAPVLARGTAKLMSNSHAAGLLGVAGRMRDSRAARRARGRGRSAS